MRRAWIATGSALIALALPAHAGADTADPFFGVVSQQRHLTDDDIERMGQGRVGTLRVSLPWNEIDSSPVPSDYDWSYFDAVVVAASRQGITLLPTIYTVPRWVSLLEGCTEEEGGPCSVTPPHTEVGLNAWRTFLGTAARRYGPDGLFWTTHPEVPKRPLRAWQIWNEQNDPGFFQPRPDVDRYAALVSAASEAIRGQDPNAEIVLGGMCCYPLDGRDGGIRATDFLRQLYQHPGIEADFDGVAIHPYAARFSRVKTQVEDVVRVVREEAGDSEAAIWISEVGWASGGEDHPLNRGPKGQARRLTKAFRYFLRARERLGIRSVLWYAWRDVSAADSNCQWCARAGLFRAAALIAKPAWASFVRFTGGS